MRIFFPAAAAAALLLAIAGFSITYLGPLRSGAIDPPLGVHLHAAVFTGWLLLFLTQSLLVRSRLQVHRRLGVLAALFIPLMLVSGAQVAITATNRGIAEGFAVEARAFLIVPLTDLLIFGTLATAALLLRRRPEHHKRLLLLATAALLPPAIARAFIPFEIVSTWPSTFAADLFLVALALRDLWRDRRLHPATLAGGAWVLAVHTVRELAGSSHAWQAIAAALTR